MKIFHENNRDKGKPCKENITSNILISIR